MLLQHWPCVVSHRRNEDGFEHIEGIAFAKSVTGKNNRVLAEAEGYKKTVQAPTFGEAGIFVAWGRKQPQLSTTLRVMAVRHAAKTLIEAELLE